MNIMVLSDLAKELYQKLDDCETTEEALAVMQEIEQKGMQIVAPLCDVIDELEARGTSRKNKAAVYSDLAKKDAEMVKSAKKAIIRVMQVAKQEKFANGSLTVSLTKGSPSLVIVDENLVPIRYKKLTIETSGDKLELLQSVLGEDLKKYSLETPKSEIKSITTDTFGVEGTRIVYTPRLTIKG